MSSRHEQRGFGLLLALNTMMYTCNALFSPFLSAYYTQQGITASQIGILSTVGPLCAILVQPLWSGRSDRTGKAKLYAMLMCVGCMAGLLSYYLGSSFWSYLGSATLLAVFFTSLLPMIDAIVIRRANKIGSDFSRIRMGGTIGYAVTVLLAGQVLNVQPALCFAMGAAGYVILLLLLSRLPASENALPTADKKEGLTLAVSKLFDTRQVIPVLVLAFVFQFAFSFVGTFLGRYVVELGYGQRELGMLNCLQAAVEIPILLVIVKLQKRIRPPVLIALGTLLMGVRLLILSGGVMGCLIASCAMQGVTYMVVHYCAATYIAAHAQTGRSAQCQGLLYLVQTGLASVLANIIGGRLIDLLGIAPSFLWMGVAVVTAAGILTILIIRKKH